MPSLLDKIKNLWSSQDQASKADSKTLEDDSLRSLAKKSQDKSLDGSPTQVMPLSPDKRSEDQKISEPENREDKLTSQNKDLEQNQAPINQENTSSQDLRSLEKKVPKDAKELSSPTEDQAKLKGLESENKALGVEQNLREISKNDVKRKEDSKEGELLDAAKRSSPNRRGVGTQEKGVKEESKNSDKGEALSLRDKKEAPLNQGDQTSTSLAPSSNLDETSAPKKFERQNLKGPTSKVQESQPKASKNLERDLQDKSVEAQPQNKKPNLSSHLDGAETTHKEKVSTKVETKSEDKIQTTEASSDKRKVKLRPVPLKLKAANGAKEGEGKREEQEAKEEKSSPQKVPEDILRFQPDNVLQNRGKPPLGIRLTLHALAVCFILLLLWAIIGKVDRVVVGEGKIVTQAQPVVLQAYSLSLVKEIRIRMGQAVKKGDILVVLDPTFAQADKTRLAERLASLTRHEERLHFELDDLPYPPKRGKPLEGSEAREERIQADIWDSRHKEYVAKLETYTEQRKKILTEMESTEADAIRRTERLKIFQELEAMRHKLYVQGIEAKAGFLDVQKDRLSVEADLLRLQASLREKKHELEGVEASRAAYVTGWRSSTAQELVKVRRDLDEAREQWNKAMRMGELVDIRAPMDAVVVDLAKRNEGSVVDEAESLVTLVPDNATLEAEVDILPEDIGYIQEGMTCAIKLSTLPYQRHGSIDGVLKALSKDSFEKEVPGGSLRVFRARITLPNNPLASLRNLPEGFTLLPGLALTAEISAGERTIIEYVLYPIVAGFDAGLREPR
ncbi:MAG: HlyD family type I secretion periplasmic adaptor subunit [Desulfovibrionaceae bacterium]|nr:HlyD family type I secretion periplasmic adaptor subunit [Desulfovibrionaceae bacterium]